MYKTDMKIIRLEIIAEIYTINFLGEMEFISVIGLSIILIEGLTTAKLIAASSLFCNNKDKELLLLTTLFQ